MACVVRLGRVLRGYTNSSHRAFLRNNIHPVSCKSTLSSFKREEDPCKKSSDVKPVINEPTVRKHPKLDLEFNCAEEAYRSKFTSELVRALLVFSLCSIDTLVDNQKKVSRSLLELTCPLSCETCYVMCFVYSLKTVSRPTTRAGHTAKSRKQTSHSKLGNYCHASCLLQILLFAKIC